MTRGSDNAERSDEQDRAPMTRAGDNAERSDAEEQRR